MTDQENKALYIAKKCVAEGMTLAGAAGVITNIQHESVFSPINVEDRYHTNTKKSDEYYTQMVDTNPSYDFATDGGQEYGYGLCQWTLKTRKTELRAFCKEKGVSIGDRDTQIAFMFKELKRDFPVVWKALTSSNSAYNCAWQFCRWFENPYNPENTATCRAQQAAPWYDFLVLHIKDEPTPEPQPTPTPQPQEDHALKLRTIDKNCSSFTEVYLLKALLINRGYDSANGGLLAVDDIWTDALTEAVVQFQKDFGLDPDGVIGPASWAKLTERG